MIPKFLQDFSMRSFLFTWLLYVAIYLILGYLWWGENEPLWQVLIVGGLVAFLWEIFPARAKARNFDD